MKNTKKKKKASECLISLCCKNKKNLKCGKIHQMKNLPKIEFFIVVNQKYLKIWKNAPKIEFFIVVNKNFKISENTPKIEFFDCCRTKNF